MPSRCVSRCQEPPKAIVSLHEWPLPLPQSAILVRQPTACAALRSGVAHLIRCRRSRTRRSGPAREAPDFGSPRVQWMPWNTSTNGRCSRGPPACGPSTPTVECGTFLALLDASPFLSVHNGVWTHATNTRVRASTLGSATMSLPGAPALIESSPRRRAPARDGLDPTVTPGTRLRDRQGELHQNHPQATADHLTIANLRLVVSIAQEVFQPRHVSAGP